MYGTISDTEFIILQKYVNGSGVTYEKVHLLSQYESLLWVDRYNECGDFEISCYPSDEILEYGVRDNIIMSTSSRNAMVIEETKFSTSFTDGIRYSMKGRSLESILERRVLLYKTVFTENLEDGIRQILDVSFIKPEDSGRQISNLSFVYSGDAEINTLEVDYEFEKGTDLLEVISTMTKNAGLGFELIYDYEEDAFKFKLLKGKDRSYGQDTNPWVIFSPKFNNLIVDKIDTNNGYTYRNFVYVEGEQYNNKAPEKITVGESTGIDRFEAYESASDINHEGTDTNGTKITLSDAEYTAQLQQRGEDKLLEFKKITKIESEVETKIGSIYGEDYFIGDVLQVENVLGYTHKIRVVEFIIEHTTAGLKMYPTFEGIEEE